MKIFVTGGSGFIGKHLVDLLVKRRHTVAILSRTAGKKDFPKVRIIRGGLGNIKKWQAELKQFNPDAAVHLAWEGLPDHSYQVSRKNLNYGLNLFELFTKTACKKIIATGSGWEYGAQPGKMSEDTVPIPFDAHTAAKHSLRMLGSELAKQNNITFIWARLFFVYGPGQRSKSLIPYMLSCLNSGQVPEIRNPNAANDFVYVEDVAEALYKLLMKGKKSETYNIGSGKLTSVSKIMKYLFKKYGINNEFKLVEKQHQDQIGSAYAGILKINKDVGWKPTTPIERGIVKTYKKFLNPVDEKN